MKPGYCHRRGGATGLVAAVGAVMMVEGDIVRLSRATEAAVEVRIVNMAGVGAATGQVGAGAMNDVASDDAAGRMGLLMHEERRVGCRGDGGER
jgi:hypothetical protein